MSVAYVSVGSNIQPADNVRRAVALLAGRARITGVSTVYRTAPIDRPGQTHYYNCTVRAETDLPPAEFKRGVLRAVEAELGRQRTADKSAPRTIDLDLILYDDLAVQSAELRLPDPDIPRRPFLAAALAELAPQLVLPGTGMTAADLAGRVGRDGLEPLREFTELLKQEIAARSE